MYSVGHNNVFIALMATSISHNSHHRTTVMQNLKGLVHDVKKSSICMGSHSH